MQKTWEEIEKEHAILKQRENMASEIVAWSHKVSKSKDFAILCLTAAIVIISVVKFGGKLWKN